MNSQQDETLLADFGEPIELCYEHQKIKQDNNDSIEHLATDLNKQPEKQRTCGQILCAYILLMLCLLLIGTLITIPFILIQINIDKKYQNICKSNNNCVFGLPYFQIENNIVENFKEFSVSFDTSKRMPIYTIYKLTSEISQRCKSSTFKRDMYLGTWSQNDIPSNIYDKGHMVPAIDIKDSCETFTMANVAPQIPCFNRGIWSQLEANIRKKFSGKYVMTIAEYDKSNYYVSNNNVIYIPIGFYKVILDDEYILWSIYISHTESVCYKNYMDIGNNKKLPSFIKIL